jgi:hypothetical protein
MSTPNDDRDEIQVEDEVEINVIRDDESDPNLTDLDSNEHA